MEPKKSLVIEGSFDNITKAEVFEVVGISRQCMEVVFSDASDPAGTIMVKAGQVLMAEKRPDQTGKPAFLGLYRDPSSDFKVYTRGAPQRMHTIGTLAELIREARDAEAATAHAPSSVVIEGTFSDFSLDEVLDVVSLSRQRLSLVLTHEDGAEGQIDCKAGQVLDATLGELGGKSAFLEIYVRTWTSFSVSRMGAAVELGAPLGTLGHLVTDARTHRSDASVESADRRIVVMEGEFDQTNLLEVLQVVGLSRQVLEVVLSDSKGTLGAIVAKSGHLLDAQQLRPEQQGLDAFFSLYESYGSRFTVLRRATRGATESLGLLSDLIDQAAHAKTTPADTTLVRDDLHIVMQGLFSDIPLRELFDVASLSRQTLTIAFFEGDTGAGRMVVKAGHVLEATAGHEDGITAFNALVNHAASRFTVHRSTTPSASTPTLGRLSTLYEDARRPAEQTAETPPAEAPSSDLILSGDFESFSLQDVLDVIALCRQRLTLRCLDGDTEVATLDVKAGMVLACREGRGQGVDAFSRLMSAHGTHFTVTRHPAQSPLPAPLGTIAELMQRSRQPAKMEKRLDIILEGSFTEFRLEEVLEVVALSRQVLQLSFRSNTSPHGGMLIKSGQVLVAKTSQIRNDGKAAIKSLLEHHGDYFVVALRRSSSKKHPKPLATVHELLAAIRSSGAAPVEAAEEAEPDEEVTLIQPFLEPPPTQVPAPPPSPEPRPSEDATIELTAALADAMQNLEDHLSEEPSTPQGGLDSALAVIAQLENEIQRQNRVLEELMLRQNTDTAAITAAVQQAMRGSFADRASLAVIAGSQLLTLLLICVLLASLFL